MEKTVYISLEPNDSVESKLYNLLCSNSIRLAGGHLIDGLTNLSNRRSRLASLANPQVPLVNDMELKPRFEIRLQDLMYEIADRVTPGLMLHFKPIVSPNGFIVLEPIGKDREIICELRQIVIDSLHLKPNSFRYIPHIIISRIEGLAEQDSFRTVCRTIQYDYPVSRFFLKLNCSGNTIARWSFPIQT